MCCARKILRDKIKVEEMNLNEILDELYNLSKFGIKLGLDNIKTIMDRLGNPQNSYKTIHIAGTNGKGSTASMLEYALIENGFRVGKYTSPHIVKFNERIVVDFQEISDEELVEYYLKVKEVSKGIGATFFEVTTAMMFLYFKDKKVQYAIIEVGMGGRYDATNIIDSDYAVITSISMDHINILGNSLYEIACEKAGIIKKDERTFVSDTVSDIRRAFEEKGKKVKYTKELYNYSVSLDCEKLHTVVNVDGESYELSLFGEFQAINFLNVYGVLRDIGLEKDTIRKAMLKVKWPGRFEIVARNPLLILDGAHNEDSAQKLYDNLTKVVGREETTMLVSILEDKEIEKILRIFDKTAHRIIFTSLKDFKRGLGAKEIYDRAFEIENKLYFEDIREAYSEARKDKVLVVAGSFYLLSKFKEVIEFV